MLWKPHPHPMVTDWLGPIKAARCENASRDNVEDPAHPGMIRSHPRLQNTFIHKKLKQTPDENCNPHRLLVDCLGLIEATHGVSCPSGQRQGPTAPGGNEGPIPVTVFSQTCTNPTIPERQRQYSGSVPPRTVFNTHRTQGRQDAIPVSEILPYIRNSNSSGTKSVIPWVHDAP